MSATQALELSYVSYELDPRGVLTVWLDRPSRRNAMNEALVSSLTTLFKALCADPSPHELCEARLCVLRGRGGHFCAGGDIEEMRDASQEELTRINRAFGSMLEVAYACPIPLVSVLEGAVMGGGFGLACVSDLTLALKSARFALPEVRLGLIPAQIAPFVARKIGLQASTRLALTGARIDGLSAERLGLVGELFEDTASLNQGLMALIDQLLQGAPHAQRYTKQLTRDSVRVHESQLSELLDQASQLLAEQAHSKEGREGLTAFLNKRKPSW
jgi:isohexenylglutaconyl-CoA hydratase